ncbi:MAG: hypothetical protein U0M60_10470 [Clostridia bacterium]|nr:hypothetical protein [Clostridia bacterium]
MIKTCTRCGRQFGTERKSNVCSDCQVIRQREYSLNYVNKNRDKLKEKRRIKKMFTDGVIYHKITDSELKIIEDNRKALAEGMTYGQYMARRFFNGQQKSKNSNR